MADRKSQKNAGSRCDECMNYRYDEEFDEYSCSVNMDEDDIYRLFNDRRFSCPYYRRGDDYTIVRKQN